MIQNLVTTADLDQTLNLSAIAIGLGLDHTEYEPEQFPGLVYRSPELTTVALLFGSGKIVLTGATDLADAEHALETVHTDLRKLDLLE